MGSLLKNWVVLIKVWKMEAKWKTFNQCKHFGEESYTFISIHEIGLLTSCYLCMTWLNWSLKLHATLWTNSYLILTHNTKSNVQWISIWFVWLYMLKCDVCMINCSLIKPKIFLSVFFFYSCFECFSQKAKIFVLKNLVIGNFATHFTSGCSPIQVVRWNGKI